MPLEHITDIKCFNINNKQYYYTTLIPMHILMKKMSCIVYEEIV